MSTPQVTFVSAYHTLKSTPYFDINSEELNPAPIFELARTGINLCLYIGVDCKFETEFVELEKECPNFRVMPYRTNYEDMWVYRAVEEWLSEKGIECSEQTIPLPIFRNAEKDTFEYLIYTHSRAEIIEDAISENPFDSTHFAWIDFHVPGLFSDKSESFAKLVEIANYSFPETASYFAGCWPRLDENMATVLAHRINWRFCGAFFLADAKTMGDFMEMYRTHFPVFLRAIETFTWEVNFWAWLEYTDLWQTNWYRADHNDTLMNLLPGISADTYATILTDNFVSRKEYNYPAIEPFLPGSASYLEHDGAHYINTRFVNYWMYPNGYYRFYSHDMTIENRNFLSKLDGKTMKPLYFKEMKGDAIYDANQEPLVIPEREKRPFSVGLEDIRLFSGVKGANGKRPVRFIATNVEYSESNRNRMIIGTYDINTLSYKNCVLTVPPDPNSWCEKNWIPVIRKNKEDVEEELFIYKWSPMEIGRIDPETNQLNIVVSHEIKPWIFSRLRGSTTFVDAPLQFLPAGIDAKKEYLIGLTHFSEEYTPRHYYHMMILLEKETLRPVRYSRVFYFESMSIEFCIGLALKPKKRGDSTYLFWISRFDRDPICLEVKKDAILLEHEI